MLYYEQTKEIKESFMCNLSIKHVVAVVFTSFASFLFAEQTYNADSVEELIAYLDAAADGDTIQLADNTYPLTAKLQLTKGVTLRGNDSNPEAVRFCPGIKKTLINVGHANAVLSGVTIENLKSDLEKTGAISITAGTMTNCIVRNNTTATGYYSTAGVYINGTALITHCVITNNTVTYKNYFQYVGGGVYMRGGTCNIKNCVISKNKSYSDTGGISLQAGTLNVSDSIISGNVCNSNIGKLRAGGVCGGTYIRCEISSNVLYTATVPQVGAGGAVNANLYDCLVYHNRGESFGEYRPYSGGVYGGSAYRTTITENFGAGNGAGAYNVKLYSSIVINNYGPAASVNADCYGCTLVNSCTSYAASGTGNILADPCFVDAANCDFRISSFSPCIGKGDAAHATNSTYVNGVPDIGYYEYPEQLDNDFEVGIELSRYQCVIGDSTTFTAKAAAVDGNITGITYTWDFGDGTTAQGETVDKVFVLPGEYFVRLSATRNGETVMRTASVPITVTANDIYVDFENGDDANSGLSEEKPKKTFYIAYRLVSDNGTLNLAKGTYALDDGLIVSRPIKIKGSNDNPWDVVLTRNVSRCMRILTANNADLMVSGLCVSNGYQRMDANGGGLCILNGTVSNCVITSCKTRDIGGVVAGVYIGSADGLLVDSVVTNCWAANWNSGTGGIYNKGGIVRRCQIVGNSTWMPHGGGYRGGNGDRCEDSVIMYNENKKWAGTSSYNSATSLYSSPGGAYGGNLYRCVIAHNTSVGTTASGTIGAGGAYNSKLYDCLVYSNSNVSSAVPNGGGLNSCTAVNCTIVGNSAANGGGTYNSTLYNCIVWDNTATSSADAGNNVNVKEAEYTCTSPLLTGTGNISIDPRLTSTFRIGGLSACVNAGDNTRADRDKDLSGNPRKMEDVVDMGCYEYDPNSADAEFGVGFNLKIVSAENSETAILTAKTVGVPAGESVEYEWDFDSDGQIDLVTTETEVTNEYTTVGAFSISVTAKTSGGKTSACVVENCVLVKGMDIYVSSESGSDENFGNDPEKPKKTIISAIGSLAVGGTLHLADGVYPQGSTLVISQPMTIKGNDANPEAVVIRRSNSTSYSVMNLKTSCVLRGIVVENGYVDNIGGIGAGIDITASSIVTNCIIRNNRIYGNNYYGAGGIRNNAAGSVIVDCVITNNASNAYHYSPGGIYALSSCEIIRCIIGWNKAAADGGGIKSTATSTVVSDCIIVNNKSSVEYWQESTVSLPFGGGGGVSGCTIKRCVIMDNMVGKHSMNNPFGGGASNSTLHDCLVAGNTSTNTANGSGGGLHSCTAVNCTIVDNAAKVAGGVSGGTLKNSIIWNNVATNGDGTDNYGGTVAFSYCCTTPAVDGEGCISKDPLLRPRNSSMPYTLRGASPCVNIGNNAYTNSVFDLSGKARVLRRTVDLGCYEASMANGLKVIVR